MESIAYCIDHNYLTDYFTKTQKEEVFDMVSFKRDEEVARSEREKYAVPVKSQPT
jgi:hypothetical protein